MVLALSLLGSVAMAAGGNGEWANGEWTIGGAALSDGDGDGITQGNGGEVRDGGGNETRAEDNTREGG